MKEIGGMKDDCYEDGNYGLYGNCGKLQYRGGKKSSCRQGFGIEYHNNGQISFIGEFENDFYRTNVTKGKMGYILGMKGNLMKRFENKVEADVEEDAFEMVYDCCIANFIASFNDWS